MKSRSIIAAIAAAILLHVPVAAHHSFAAEFDANKPVTLTGKLTKMEWTNPHGWIFIDVTGADGKVVNFFADIGKLLLMFFAGFEVDIEQFNRARRKAATFGLFTFACPFVLAAMVGVTIGYPPIACAVIGAVLASHCSVCRSSRSTT